MSAVAALAGIMPGFECCPGHQRSSLIDKSVGPVVARLQGILLLNGRALGFGTELGQHSAAGDKGLDRFGSRLDVGVLPDGQGVDERTLQNGGLIGAQLWMVGDLRLARLSPPGFEVDDDQPPLGINLQSVHLTTKHSMALKGRGVRIIDGGR